MTESTADDRFFHAAEQEGGLPVSAGARVAHVQLALAAGRAFQVDLSDVPQHKRAAVVAVVVFRVVQLVALQGATGPAFFQVQVAFLVAQARCGGALGPLGGTSRGHGFRPVGYGPTHILMSRRSRGQLQRSRTTYSPTGSPSPLPTEYEGIPIIVTDAIRDTEELLS